MVEIDSLLKPFGRFGVNLGLKRIIRLLENLGNPHDGVPIIHVAGTNGKGSVCAYISYVLTEAGYKVGRYTSPHLVDWTERICINEKQISPDDLCRVLLEVKAKVLSDEDSPTQFEILTAAAWLYFVQQKVDVVVMEVGLGGRLDATNVCSQPLVSIITSISKDHLQVLGSTIAEIATEKAGILKTNCPVVIGTLPEEAEKVVRSRAEKLHCPLFVSSPAQKISPGLAKWDSILYQLPLEGEIQLNNSSVAIAALKILQSQGWNISDDCIANGIAKTKWLGRMQWSNWKNSKLLVDGAHNPNAALALRNYVDTIPHSSIFWIIGMLANKQHQEIFSVLLRPEDKLYLVPIPEHSCALPSQLKELAFDICPHLSFCQTFPDLFSAIDAASSAESNQNEELITLCGSLYLIGSFLATT
ncbi:MAG: folylpolyglutamate synthase/dihydrofolate synthase family protein [Cyanobacteria bacterium P01_A01_bin.84]